jgi:divalent metal cation (Fe/Co/Zn/Cd) transporter
MAGLGVIWSGRFLAPGLNLSWVDPVTAIAVAVLIVHAAWELVVQATGGLLDESLPQEDIEYIRGTAIDRGDICSLHDIKTRKAGPERIVDAHVSVDYSLTVLEGHDKGKSFKGNLLAHWPASWITIHVDPCDGSCKAPCLSGCLLDHEHRDQLHEAWKIRPKA